MRIISGKYKGRKIEGFDIDGTRPTQDRVKESMFAMIQDYLVNSVCLDLFSGSGNLGIEALSNGASVCYFNDNNKECIKIIKRNLKDIDNYFLLNLDYKEVFNYLEKEKIKLDMIFLDPPYDLDCLDYILNKTIENNVLNVGGLIVCEYEFDNFKDNYNNLELIKEKKYGYKNIRIYRRIK